MIIFLTFQISIIITIYIPKKNATFSRKIQIPYSAMPLFYGFIIITSFDLYMFNLTVILILHLW